MKRLFALALVVLFVFSHVNGLSTTSFKTKVEPEWFKWGDNNDTIERYFTNHRWRHKAPTVPINNVKYVYSGGSAFGWEEEAVIINAYVHDRYGLYQLKHLLSNVYSDEMNYDDTIAQYDKLVLDISYVYGKSDIVEGPIKEHYESEEIKSLGITVWVMEDNSSISIELFRDFMLVNLRAPEYNTIKGIIELEEKTK